MSTHRPDLQSPAGLEEDVPGHWHEEEREVDHQVVGEEYRADHGDAAQYGNRSVRHSGDGLGTAYEVPEQSAGRTYSEHLKSDSRDSLRSAERDDYYAEEQAEQSTHECGEKQSEPVPSIGHGSTVAHEERDKHSEERTHRHDTLTAEVEHAAALVEHLADRGKKKSDRERHRHRQDVDYQIHFKPPCLHGVHRSVCTACPPDMCSGGSSAS